MKKKILKYSIIPIILVITLIVCILFNYKDISVSKLFAQTKQWLDGTDDSITYSTNGDDDANYEDGDKSKKKVTWVKDGDVWKYTFYVEDPNAQWYVWEESSSLMDGYTSDFTEENIGTLFTTEELEDPEIPEDATETTNDDGKKEYTWLDDENSYKVIGKGDGKYLKITTKLSFTITNQMPSVEPQAEVKYGKLIIKKIVQDSEGTVLDASKEGRTFTFTVTLTAGTADSDLIADTKIFGNMAFKNGVATVALKAGETVTITDIPEGIHYKVEEKEVAGYTTENNDNEGNIEADKEKTVTFTNRKEAEPADPDEPGTGEPDDPEQKYVNLTIKKVVTGNNEVDEEYGLEVELNNLKPNKIYNLSDGTNFVADELGSANVSIKLKNNESITIQQIPVGSKYKVFEYAGDYISSYTITDASNLGLINSTSNTNTKQNVPLTTATETADDGENVTITFTNQKTVTQNLKIAKTVTDESDTKSYMFDIEFANMEENSSFNSSVGKITAEPNGKAELTIELAGGEQAEFYDIPVGTTYRIKELASTTIASYQLTDANGVNKFEKQSDANKKAKKALSTEIETVNQGEDVTVTFINDTTNIDEENAKDVAEVSLGITKNVIDLIGKTFEDIDETFEFELTAENTQTPMPENNMATVKGTGTASFGTISFEETGTYTYTIKEKTENSKEDYEYDDSVYTVVYEVTNTEGLLEATKKVKKNGITASSVVFENKYKKEEKTKKPSGEDKKEEESIEPSDEDKKGEEFKEPSIEDKKEEESNVSNNGHKKEETLNSSSNVNKEENEESKDTSDEYKIDEISNEFINEPKERVVSIALPKTGDSIIFYIILSITSVIVLIIILIIKNQK